MEWSMRIYSNAYDGSGPIRNYEPYGILSVDFGTKKGIKLWEVARDKNLDVPIGESKTISGRYEFPDDVSVAPSGEMLILHGGVFDSDYTFPDHHVDDIIGRYEGQRFTATQLRNGQTFFGRSFFRNGKENPMRPESRVTIKISIEKTLWILNYI